MASRWKRPSPGLRAKSKATCGPESLRACPPDAVDTLIPIQCMLQRRSPEQITGRRPRHDDQHQKTASLPGLTAGRRNMLVSCFRIVEQEEQPRRYATSHLQGEKTQCVQV